MRLAKPLGSSRFVYFLLAFLGTLPILLQAENNPVKLTDQITARVPGRWRLVPTTTRNMVQLELPVGSGERPISIRVIVSTETRTSHEDAIKRLQEIDGEQPGKVRFFTIDGWPALERISVVELPSLGAEQDEKLLRASRNVRATVVTVAVGMQETVVRYEGTLQPDIPKARTEDVLKLAEDLRFATKAQRRQTDQDLELLKRRPFKPEPNIVRGRTGGALHERETTEFRDVLDPEILHPLGSRLRAPGPGVPGCGEVQIAASPDGKNVFVATNAGASFSTNFGASYAVSSAPFGFLTRGDPSTGVGFSGAFYLSTLGRPTVPAKGCSASVARSTDNGANFSFAGHAAFCPFTGDAMCTADQEQMAVDQFHTPAGLDQLYVVWRFFPPENGDTDCTMIGGGDTSPIMSCSEDSGVDWPRQVLVGTGDIGRVAVGSDTFVYVTYVSGSDLMINKFSSCSRGLDQQPGFPVKITSFNGVQCPVPGLDRCDYDATSSPQPAVDDANPSHVFVAYADGNGGGNEDVILRESLDGGLTWPLKVNMNMPVPARRFMPWVCATKGNAYVSWYDRRTATTAAPDLTAYFANSAAQVGASLLVGPVDRNVSGVSDPQCASGWPASVEHPEDATSCPPTAPQKAGRCVDSQGAVTGTTCDFNAPVCPSGDLCLAIGGFPKYGDYNGNACARSGVYLAWASATPPAGVALGPPRPEMCATISGINVFTDRLNFATNGAGGSLCGGTGQPCCFQGGAACSSPTLACDTTNTCSLCGGTGQACCTAAGTSQCGSDLVCVGGQCQCGGPGQPCCGTNASCQAGFSCDVNRTCSCGGEGQPCCGGNSCSSAGLVCDQRTFQCITDCGHQGQACCGGTSCLFGSTCSNNTCVCGGLNQACCLSGNACGSNLSCTNHFCTPSGGVCATCAQNKQSCLNRCGPNDQYCQCLCDNSYCGCTGNSCGPQCSFQSCHP